MKRLWKWIAPWVAIPLTDCAVWDCKEPRIIQEHENRLVGKDNPEDMARRYCIRHAFERDRECLAQEEPAEVVELFESRAA